MQFHHSSAGIGRFRVNCYIQRGAVAMVLRPIPEAIPTFDELHLPEKLKESLRKTGLVLFVRNRPARRLRSPPVGYRNEIRGHIVTIETRSSLSTRTGCPVAARSASTPTRGKRH
jgi:twitching motility protein PilU